LDAFPDLLAVGLTCLLSTVYCLLSTVYCLLSTVYCLLSTVYCLLSVLFHLFPTYHLLPTTYSLLIYISSPPGPPHEPGRDVPEPDRPGKAWPRHPADGAERILPGHERWRNERTTLSTMPALSAAACTRTALDQHRGDAEAAEHLHEGPQVHPVVPTFARSTSAPASSNDSSLPLRLELSSVAIRVFALDF